MISPFSDDAIRYFRSGKSFLYRTLPFWLASVADRMLLLLVPLTVLIVPAVRSIPMVYRWRVRSRIHRVYGRLLAIERKALLHAHDDGRSSLLDELNTIEKSLDTFRLPLSHVDSLYILREHVALGVRVLALRSGKWQMWLRFHWRRFDLFHQTAPSDARKASRNRR